MDDIIETVFAKTADLFDHFAQITPNILNPDNFSNLDELFQTKGISIILPPTTDDPTFIGKAADGTRLVGTLNDEGGITFSEGLSSDDNWNEGAKNYHFSQDELNEALDESGTVIQQDQIPPTTEGTVTTQFPEAIEIEADDASKIIELLQKLLDKMEDGVYLLDTNNFFINGDSIEGIKVTDGKAYFYSGDNLYSLRDCLDNDSFATILHANDNKDLLIPFVIGAAVGGAILAGRNSKKIDGSDITPITPSSPINKKNADAMAKTFDAHKNRPHLSSHLEDIGINADKLNAVAAAITNEQFKEIVANKDTKSLMEIEGIGPKIAEKILNESADYANSLNQPKNN